MANIDHEKPMYASEMAKAASHFQELCYGREVSKETQAALDTFEKFQRHIQGTEQSMLVFYYP